MRHTVEEIIAAHRRGKRLKYLFFWGHTERPGAVTKACLSQWYRCTFTVDGAVYHTAEQYMMAQKARLFGDERIYNAIMAAKHPKQYKALSQRETR